MKTLLLTIMALFVSLLSINAQSTTKPVDMKFIATEINLGEVEKGDIETFKYYFENSGTENIEIEEVTGCSCTSAVWTKGVIKPGEKGEIEVTFRSADKKESGTVSVDVYLTNIDPEWDAGYLFELSYDFELIQK